MKLCSCEWGGFWGCCWLKEQAGPSAITNTDGAGEAAEVCQPVGSSQAHLLSPDSFPDITVGNTGWLMAAFPMFCVPVQAWLLQVHWHQWHPLSGRSQPLQLQSPWKVRNKNGWNMFRLIYFMSINRFYFLVRLEIEARPDMQLESDMKLDKLESFLGRLNNKGW